VVHFNDSREPFNSKKDRHWHIGGGFIGRDALRRIFNDERLKQIPFIMETPGDERDDRCNMLRTRRFIAPALRPALLPFRRRA
jgi:deoxyribonuclease-4